MTSPQQSMVLSRKDVVTKHLINRDQRNRTEVRKSVKAVLIGKGDN